MKVLFAVGSDQLSRNIADRYYEKYGEVLEYKNVFFYKALLEEVKKNKTYDRIVINEMFEEIKSNDIERIDSFVFNNIDKITDEIQDAEIILVCADWRNAGDSFVSKLFSIGIYNMLLGNDRSLNPLCEIIKKPRNKRDAKQYLNIDTALITDSSITKENEVEENQVKSILSFYEGIKNQPEKYLETFDRVAEQYNRTQLKIIVEYLPKVVKDEIFKADRYKYLQPQVDVPQIGNNVNNAVSGTNVNNNANVKVKTEVTKLKKHGFFSSLKKAKTEPASKGGTLDMAEMQSSGRVDLSSNAEEHNKAALEAEAKRREFEEKTRKAEEELNRQAEELARQQAELEARARVEAEKRRQEELAAKAKAEVEARQKADAEAKARAEAAAKQQAELEAKARAEAAERERIEKARAERQKQIELEARARAEAAAKEQAKLAEKAKQEALEREQAMQAEKAKASENAKEQAELAARARAEAMARQQTEMAAKAKAEATARANAGFVSSMTGGAEIPKAPGTLIEVKPNPKAPDRQIQKTEIPTPTVNVSQSAKLEKNDIVIDNKVDLNKANINVNPEPPKVTKNITTQPEIKITTNSGVAPTKVNTETVREPEKNPVKPTNTTVTQPQVPVSSVTNNVANNVAMLEQEKKMKEEQEKLAAEQRKIKELQAKLEEEKRKLREEQEKFVSAQNQLRNEINNSVPQYSNNALPVQTSPTANFKKMVVFVGANKVGTTFVTNAVAHSVASAKIKTSIIDMTRDRSLYYIYADESKAMKNRAAECMQRLSEGEDYYIETMNSHLKLYTSLAGSLSDQRRGYKHRVVIDTVKKNCNLTIVDADFTTPIDYFDQADEIYLIQDLDVLKIQDVTLFLRELNARGLDKKKIKLIINRYVKTSITPKIIIGALDFYHDPAGTYVDSGLMPNKVDYSIIPYNLNNYAKYVESLHKMSGNFNYKSYSADFNQAIDEIVAKVYPKNHGGKRRFFG